MFLSELIHFAKVWVPEITSVFFFYLHDYDSLLFWRIMAELQAPQPVWGGECTIQEKFQFSVLLFS